MDVRLYLRVERDTGGRLSGEIIPAGQPTSHGFSGTLEMLKILEDLVLVGEGSETGRPGAGAPGDAGPSLPGSAGT